MLCGGSLASWLLCSTLDEVLWVQVLAGDIKYIHGQIKKIFNISRKEQQLLLSKFIFFNLK